MRKGTYKDLEICQLAHTLAVECHQVSLRLPKFEMYEEGSQLRRSSKSISSLIVEGFIHRFR
ncbi:MAG: four helix bundle protein [Desulfobacterales bacterium]|nr:four helix bundle protein [Desulfobacterales bacterium]